MKRTATEAAIIQDAANARAADKLSIIEASIGRTARKLLQLAQQIVEQEQVARITSVDGKQAWFEFTSDEIAGEFDFEVEGGSTQPNNETARRQQAVSMMNALGPLIGQVIDPQEIARHVLQHGFGVKNPSKFLMPPPPPMPPEGEAPPEQGPPEEPMPEGVPPEMPPEVPPGADQMMMPPEMSAGVGVDAEQPSPQELEELKRLAMEAQLMGQVGYGGVPGGF